MRQRAKKSRYQYKVFVCVSNSRADAVDRLLIYLYFLYSGDILNLFYIAKYSAIVHLQSYDILSSQSYDFCTRLFFTFHFTDLEVIFFMTMHFIIEYIKPC